MKFENYTSKNELKILKAFFAFILLFTVISINSKYISGYNLAIADEQTKLQIAADATSEISFGISDCYNFYNHPALFSLFSAFLFLSSLSVKSITKTLNFSAILFCFLSLSILQATYLSEWFANVLKIKWNALLVLPNIFDAILYSCFAIVLIFQVKILYRFTKEKFQAKISLR